MTTAIKATGLNLISPNLIDRCLAEYVIAVGAKEFTRKMFVDYRAALIAKYSPSTVNLYLTAAKLFVGFLQQEGLLQVNPTEHLKGLKVIAGHKKDALSATDTKKILANFNTSTLKGKRDKALYALMTTAGLRTVEVARANVGDISERDGKIFLYVQGKGHSEKDATVRIPDGVYNFIRDYLTARADVSANAPLFASVARRNFGGAMTTVSISRIIKTALKSAGCTQSRRDFAGSSTGTASYFNRRNSSLFARPRPLEQSRRMFGGGGFWNLRR